MTYTNEDARFDAEQQGRCPICGRTPMEGCTHCDICGRPGCQGECEESEAVMDWGMTWYEEEEFDEEVTP